MPRFHADLASALTRAFAELKEPRRANPAWLPHLDSSALVPVEIGVSERDLVRRALVAPVVAALGVTTDGDHEELRIALDAEGAVLLTRAGAGPHEWMDSAPDLVPDLVHALLPTGSRLSAAPRMTPRGEHTALRLTRDQRAAIADRLRDGTAARDAIASQDDLSAPQRDAVTADGERATFDLSMHVPPAGDARGLRFRLVRRWGVGALGLYCTDEDEGLDGAIHRVADGDVLGTVLPLLAEGTALVQDDGQAA